MIAHYHGMVHHVKTKGNNFPTSIDWDAVNLLWNEMKKKISTYLEVEDLDAAATSVPDRVGQGDGREGPRSPHLPKPGLWLLVAFL